MILGKFVKFSCPLLLLSCLVSSQASAGTVAKLDPAGHIPCSLAKFQGKILARIPSSNDFGPASAVIPGTSFPVLFAASSALRSWHEEVIRSHSDFLTFSGLSPPKFS